MTTESTSAHQIFDGVIQQFKDNLDKDELYDEILKVTTVDEVYDLTDKLQQEQVKDGHLRHLSKIEPFLAGLNDYASAIEVFMQAKPEVLALIWGPIKLIIQWTSVLKQSFDAIINLTAEIGALLPEFQQVNSIFDSNDHIKEILALFFKDLLDFYLIALRFFTLSRWKYVFESLWPRHRRKIQVVIDHINRLAVLMRNEVRLEHIQAEHNHRLRALEHFELAEKSHQRQEYNSIKADISPPTYHESLNLLLGRICQGTGRWLLNDSDFNNWLDTSDSSTQLLWLQGIPGAGKTYLSGTVITQAWRRHKTIYAFLSHTARRSTSALSILHSLIFQLGSDDDTVQESLVQCSRENLKSSVDGATDLFTTLIRCAGPTYVVIDGVDEIEEIERYRILTQLLQVSDSCKEAKILISSRPEFDITKTLQDKATIIRVDQRNSGSIQTYVTQRTQSWFGEREFLPAAKSQIEGLLAPVAWKSKGMFLYARIILNNIEDLDVHDICRELRALPESLEEASVTTEASVFYVSANIGVSYGRILNRINNSKPMIRKKVRRILGWIGCSPTPLTVQELEQALTVDPSDLQQSNIVLSSMNITKICGPIVEVIDGCVNFVHFTVKEYLFSPKINNYLDEREATLNLAICCISYLCQDQYNQDISNEELRQNVLDGVYRFHQYATSTWFELVLHSVRSMSSNTLPDSLTVILRTLMLERENTNYNESAGSRSHSDFEIFKSNSNDLYQFLCRMDQFRQIFSKPEFRMDKGDLWTNLDPLTISKTSTRVFEETDKFLECEDEDFCRSVLEKRQCHCATIRWHYGQWPFKCRFLSCSFRRSGFDTRSFINSHVQHHDKPWNCSFPGCNFAEGGFLSRKMRDDHFDRFHQEQNSKIMAKFTDLNKDDLQPMFFDLILTDNIEVIKSILPKFEELPAEINTQLLRLVAESGSLAMLELIRPAEWQIGVYCLEGDLFQIVQSAISGRNLKTCPYLIAELKLFERGFSNVANLLPNILASDSEELLSIWASHAYLSGKLIYSSQRNNVQITDKLANTSGKNTLAFACPKVIRATAGQHSREEKLIWIWMKFDICRLCTPLYLGQILGFVAQTTCSIKLAKFLLEHGAEVDSRGLKGRNRPLEFAARHTTAQAAELMMLLLLKGANPDRPKIRDQQGTKGISKWLNMTWDEVVAHARNEREKLRVQGTPSQHSYDAE